MRILVTGSRDWADDDVIEGALADIWNESGRRVTLVSGACPTGADAISEECAKIMGWEVERHPADWSRGRKAGPERNAHMVSLGADICLAFIGPCTSPRCNRTDEHDSHGATGCADLAEHAGIPTHRFRPASRAALTTDPSEGESRG
jgi:hypothetical protein